ncbi:hypothetical protein RRF57_010123 [Xylaria bambusicola]|uniref:Uncharacterized protein n=1 Tax=Xylaria bambusicola TaxID=326684 RepID=A0AAN7UWS5_9PEZI
MKPHEEVLIVEAETQRQRTQELLRDLEAPPIERRRELAETRSTSSGIQTLGCWAKSSLPIS